MSRSIDNSQATQSPEEDIPVWWVWFDQLLEEWFYSDTSPRTDATLHAQLRKEKTTVYQVHADTGVQAIAAVCPGYLDDRRPDPVTRPASPSVPRPN